MSQKSSRDLVHRLSQYAHRLTYQQLPQNVIHQAKIRVIDSLCCALATVKTKPARILRKTALKNALNSKGATLIGTKQKVFAPMAAFYNGSLIRYWDYNDTYLSKEPAHPSDNLGALISAAELMKSTGKDFITAMVLSYEIQCRLCDAQSLRTKGWDHVTYGALSASLGVGKLMKLTEAELSHAVSMTTVSGVALRQTRVGEISYWKASAFAQVSRNALFSALLAKEGMTGPSSIISGEKGFEKGVSGPLNIKALGGRNHPFKILETYLKYYPVEYHSQAAVQAALELRKQIASIDLIQKINITTYDVAIEIIVKDPEKWKPKERETADHSLPFAVARSLLDGKMTLKQYSDKKISDPKVLKLMKKIKIKESSSMTQKYPKSLPCRIEIQLRGGRKVSSEVIFPKGHYRNPLTDDEVNQKFIQLTQKHLSSDNQKKILDQLWNLEKLKHWDELLKLMVV